jgi:hypothetical protein
MCFARKFEILQENLEPGPELQNCWTRTTEGSSAKKEVIVTLKTQMRCSAKIGCLQGGHLVLLPSFS